MEPIRCERSGAVMGPYEENQKPSKVLYDALNKGRSFSFCVLIVFVALEDKEVDVLICDTSGRLHTNYGLMEELAKCKRTLSKKLPNAPHEVLLVLDGTTGKTEPPFF